MTGNLFQQLKDQVELNRKEHGELVEAFNKNFRTYTDAFQHLDTRIGALMLVLNDIVELLHHSHSLDENILTTTVVKSAGSNSSIGEDRHQPHWEAYIKFYLKLIQASSADSTINSVDDSQDSQDYQEVVFGGEGNTHVKISPGGETSPST
jgi:hypothetical protein